ncbi:MAG: hypothetical protein HY924_04405 [Elusimicrobia bacterium]|nr:hypothetical protein [Elusimicrobiota bacterium]
MRLLILEFFPTVLCRNEKAFFFPFLSGIGRSHGCDPVWLCLGETLRPDGAESSGRIFRAVPTALDLKLLAARLKGLKATHIVSSELLSPAALRVLRSAAPQAKLLVMPTPQEVHSASSMPRRCAMRSHADALSPEPEHRKFFPKCGWFLDWLGVRDETLAGSYLVEAEPDYRAEMLNEAARFSQAHITIMGGSLCGNLRTLDRNPCFAKVLSKHADHRGCAFCGSTMHPFSPPGQDVPGLVERQFRAILKSRKGQSRTKGVYEFFDIHAFRRFDEVFEVVLRLGVPSGVFLFNPRIDDVLTAADRIEKVLPRLAKAGHEVRILSMGIENFSPAENLRFNKDISPAQVDRLIELTRRWGKAYPKVFRPFKGGSSLPEFGVILYTPWTTLKDLRINLEAASARGFGGAGYWLYSTLLMYPDSPLHSLALEEKGIAAKRFPDRGAVYGAFSNEEESRSVVPWKFKDTKVADFFAIMVRVSAAAMEGAGCPFFKGDREFRGLERIYTEASESCRVTPLAVAFRLLGLMERGTRGSKEELLREAVREPAQSAGPSEEHAGRRFAPSSPTARAGEKLFRKLASRTPRDLRSLKFCGVQETPTPVGRAICVSVSVAGRRLDLDLVDASAPGPYFLRSRRFKAVLSRTTPSSDPSERKALEALLLLIDKSCAAAA